MKEDKLIPLLGRSWVTRLKENKGLELLEDIFKTLREEREKTGREIFPHATQVFWAFLSTPVEDVKVVIIGEKPYSGKYVDKIIADGLCFSCGNTKRTEGGLFHLYRGIEEDLFNGLNIEMELGNDLSYLAKEGVLLLNLSLTTTKENSHISLWKPFIEKVIEVINVYCQNVVFILLGEDVGLLEKVINPVNHFVLKAELPPSLSYSKNSWRHNNIFSKTNTILEQCGKLPISWVKVNSSVCG